MTKGNNTGDLWFGNKRIGLSGFLVTAGSNTNPIMVEPLTLRGTASKQAVMFLSVEAAGQLRDALDALLAETSDSKAEEKR